MKSRPKPLQATMLDHHDIKTTRWPQPPTAQIMLCCKHDSLLFAPGDAGQGAAMPLIGPPPHFHKHHRAIGLAHNQVNLATATTRCAVIACQQFQTTVLQIGQGLVFRVISKLFGGAQRCMLKVAH